MARVATTVVIGILCLAMAAGVFMGPPASAPNSEGPGGAQAPISKLQPSDKTRLKTQRAVVHGLFKATGGETASMDTVEGKLAAIQQVLDKAELRANPAWELQCLGVVFGDALVQGVGMRWVVAANSRGRQLALAAPGLPLLAFPREVFLDEAGRRATVDPTALYQAIAKQLEDSKAAAKPQG